MALTKVTEGIRTLGTGEVVDANIATDTISINKISGSAAAGANTFLKKDGTWASAGSTSASDLDSGTLANARLANPVDLSAQTGSMKFPVGTTAQRPTGATGMVRMNSTEGSPEWYDTVSGGWLAFGSGLPYSIDFLVVAGAGGGGGGGGGAGGYRASWNSEASGGGGSSESSFSATPGGAVLTVTVGGGGSGWIWPTATNATNGNDSVFETVTSVGGGAGSQNDNGHAGGSGGGGGTSGGSATTNQGYAGGGGGGVYQNTGGGGAGEAGETYPGHGGDGGDGVASTISGGSVVRAGGGGGAGDWSAAAGAGGNGGGGNAGTAGGAGSTGGSNTGGGGGGGALNTAGNAIGAGKYGGSGVVILRMLTSKYSGTTTGSPSVSTSGTDTILTFNASGSYTP